MAALHAILKKRWPESILEAHNEHGDETVIVARDKYFELVKFVKEDAAFSMNVLMDLTAVDGLSMKWRPRFQVVCHLYSIKLNHRLRVKVPAEGADPVVPSLTKLWPIANWFEREAWDMFGIKFAGHPNLKRILMYEEFKGHPLRKDYPINKRQPLIGPKV